ncbi:LuxR family transcriptional regulator [Streptomyces sp. SID3343]|uniref:helix-turn-helix transcriptional regulator n=1 Tax=Streptomyces sp. SID3343 TaxID=2690260 RepID=UPI00136C8320|nr:LuxR family transcriptional regulator [Streptomyces sp. SID3343]MYW03299.1 AAA family ATPase [Streptomyces sp. SID3343]
MRKRVDFRTGEWHVLFVGRTEEMERLDAERARCANGGGAVVTVGGPVAVGKTALLHAFGDRVTEQGALLLRAVGTPMEADFPLGVVRQLLQSAPLDEDDTGRVDRLLDNGAYTAAFSGTDALGAPMVRAVHELCAVVLALAEKSPVVVVVDDIQQADSVSLQFVAHLIRRIRTASVLVVLGEREQAAAGSPAFVAFSADVERQPRHTRLRLGLLSRTAVTALIADRLGTGAAARLGADVHQVSGGNPLLVKALLDDLGPSARWESSRRPVRVTVADAYCRALVGCLYRLDPAAAEVARGMAILGESESSQGLAELLDLEPATAVRAARALNDAGLVACGRFRDDRARIAVLDTMTRPDRERAHGRAATLLHVDGAASESVAKHLGAAGEFRAPWVVRTLREAAEAVAAEGDLRLAVDYLKLAERVAPDECSRVSIKAFLIGLEWLVNPAAAARHVPWLATAVRDGRLSGRDALVCVRYLAWYGRLDEAKAVIDAGWGPCASGDESAWATAAEMRSARVWLKYWYPAADTTPPGHGTQVSPLPATISRIEGLDLLTAVLGDRLSGNEVSHRAERILRGSRLDDTTVESLTSTLTALVYADRAAEAQDWCVALLDQAADRRSPIAHALLAAVLGEIAVRQGDLLGAEEQGRTALTRILPEGWGVAVGVPLAARITSAVARGDHDAAARHLELPVPGAMFHTPSGLHYLHACGRYNLATGRADAALHDFTSCGELMTAWGIDLPGIVPWRVEAARAHLALGNDDAARALLDEQFDRLRPGPSRTRGLALAVRAAVVDLRRRPALLWQAIRELQACGDRFELSRVYASLSHAYRELDDFGRARRAAHRAAHLSEVCRAEPLQALLRTDRLSAVPDGDPMFETDSEMETNSEAGVGSGIGMDSKLGTEVAAGAKAVAGVESGSGVGEGSRMDSERSRMDTDPARGPGSLPPNGRPVPTGTGGPPMPGAPAMAAMSASSAMSTGPAPSGGPTIAASRAMSAARVGMSAASAGPDEQATVELSDAERRVAALAAQGQTNREISRRLFVTVSTVEQHLTRVYRKLGVARRMDLPPWLEEEIAG